MVATTKIGRIGNSRGIRVPKLLLEQADLPDEVELRAEPGRLVVSAAKRTREGWAAAARPCATETTTCCWMRAHRRGSIGQIGSGDDAGDVHLVRLDPTLGSAIKKTRPCVVVSPDELNAHLRTAIVAPMTTGGKAYPWRIRCRFQDVLGGLQELFAD